MCQALGKHVHSDSGLRNTSAEGLSGSRYSSMVQHVHVAVARRRGDSGWLVAQSYFWANSEKGHFSVGR
eukprot:2910723-Rhodomonas_salina.1